MKRQYPQDHLNPSDVNQPPVSQHFPPQSTDIFLPQLQQPTFPGAPFQGPATTGGNANNHLQPQTDLDVNSFNDAKNAAARYELTKLKQIFNTNIWDKKIRFSGLTAELPVVDFLLITAAASTHVATEAEKLQMIQFLLNKDANVLSSSPVDGETALMHAVARHKTAVVKELVTHDSTTAHINAVDREGKTAIFKICSGIYAQTHSSKIRNEIASILLPYIDLSFKFKNKRAGDYINAPDVIKEATKILDSTTSSQQAPPLATNMLMQYSIERKNAEQELKKLLGEASKLQENLAAKKLKFQKLSEEIAQQEQEYNEKYNAVINQQMIVLQMNNNFVPNAVGNIQHLMQWTLHQSTMQEIIEQQGTQTISNNNNNDNNDQHTYQFS